jgi:GMP synthase-like glutamine amidotransferase
MRERYRREHLEQLNALPTSDKIDYAVRTPAVPWALQTPSDPNGSATRIRRKRGRLLVVQHVSFAGPGPLRAQLEAAGLVLDVIDVSAAAALPSTLEHYDALVVLGGPQSVLDRQGWPTRTQEATLVAEALRDEVPYLGVCLGAQLLGVEAGGVAYRGPAAEVGWTRVATTAQCALDPVFRVVPRRLHVMSSHVDHVSLPAGATRLMSSSAYPNQAFRVGRIAWGTQFHPEADAAFAAPRRRLVPGWAEAEVPANGDERFFERHAGAIFAAVFSRFAAFVDAAATRRRELSPALLNRP